MGLAGGRPFPDSGAAQGQFADGSCGQFIDTAEGGARYRKETSTALGAGFVGETPNFQKRPLHRGRQQRVSSYNSKVHAEQRAAWAACRRGAAPHPLPCAQARASMALTCAVRESMPPARTVEI